jgi:hypothetical protein
MVWKQFTINLLSGIHYQTNAKKRTHSVYEEGISFRYMRRCSVVSVRYAYYPQDLILCLALSKHVNTLPHSSSTFGPESTFVFSIILRINSDYFLRHHWSVETNGDQLCFLWGEEWIFKRNLVEGTATGFLIKFSVDFLGPIANTEFVAKFHVTLHAFHIVLSILT